MGGFVIRLTAKERILLHLLDFVGHRDAIEVPPGMTHDGIAEGSGIEPRHVPQYARPLIREGLVRERLAHVRGAHQRRKVHDLTDSGRMTAVRLRENLKAQVVRVRDAQGVREAAIGQVLAEAREGVRLLDVIRAVEAEDPLDLRGFRPSGGVAFIEMISDAPRIANFVGRSKELAVLTNPEERARVFVVRGVAGIGKSTFGAKACELLRGRKNLFWHRVRPWDTHRTLLSSLGGFLVSLDRPGLRAVMSRGDESEATTVLREDLPGTNSFLVFDDAQEGTKPAVAVFRLLVDAIREAEDVKMLVLTRRSLSFYDRRDVVLERLVCEMDLEGLSAEDAIALLPPAEGGVIPPTLRKRLRGHPLFLRLVASSGRLAAADGLQDVRRFIEEGIYTELSEAERRMAKMASLYEVSVPREAFFADPHLTQDTFLSLVDRALVQPAGEDTFQVHGTIREFFADLLTSSEKQQLGSFAGRELRRLASEAEGRGDQRGCVNYLSNAARLAHKGEELLELSEALGDAYDRSGVLPDAIVAYKQAARLSSDPDAVARLHRKCAMALRERDNWRETSQETAAVLTALGRHPSVERAWAELLLGYLAEVEDDLTSARSHMGAALGIFQTFGNRQGETRVRLELALIEVLDMMGDHEGAVKHLQQALVLAESVSDSESVALAHSLLAFLYAYYLGDIEGAVAHLAEAEAAAATLDSVRIHLNLHRNRAWIRVEVLGDFEEAETDFQEVGVLARKYHERRGMATLNYGRGLVSFYRGRFEEAIGSFKEAATVERGIGDWGMAMSAVWMAAESCLLHGDIDGFQRIAGLVQGQEFARGVTARPVQALVLRGLDLFLRHDDEDMHRAFGEAIRIRRSQGRFDETPCIHIAPFVYGVILRILGREDEATRYISEAKALLERFRLKAGLTAMADHSLRLTRILRDARQTRKR